VADPKSPAFLAKLDQEHAQVEANVAESADCIADQLDILDPPKLWALTFCEVVQYPQEMLAAALGAALVRLAKERRKARSGSGTQEGRENGSES